MNKKGLKQSAACAFIAYAWIIAAASAPLAAQGKTVVGKKPTAPVTRAKKRKPAVMGFREGVMFVSVFGGKALAPAGSLIEHEKKYDETVRNGIELGAYGARSALQPGFAIHSHYGGGSSGQLELEYGTWANFGMGISLLNFSVLGKRQDVFMFPAGVLPSGNYLYEPAPRNRKLYHGTSLMYLLTWHPLKKSRLDPYLAFRAGVTGFTGHAHARLTPDPNRYSSKIRNGLGAIVGAGIGVNWFFDETAGLKIEAAYYRQHLRADQLQRSLGTVHVQAGYVLNFNSVLRGK